MPDHQWLNSVHSFAAPASSTPAQFYSILGLVSLIVVKVVPRECHHDADVQWKALPRRHSLLAPTPPSSVNIPVAALHQNDDYQAGSNS